MGFQTPSNQDAKTLPRQPLKRIDMTKIADLHCHPSLKPTFNEDIDNLWVEKKNITTRALFRGGGLSDKLRKLAIDMFLKNMAR